MNTHTPKAVHPTGQNAVDMDSTKLPIILFCGWDVYSAMTADMKRRTSGENVSDVLDTVVKLLRGHSVVERSHAFTSASLSPQLRKLLQDIKGHLCNHASPKDKEFIERIKEALK